jgi:DNA-binding response OmpR family regulator
MDRCPAKGAFCVVIAKGNGAAVGKTCADRGHAEQHKPNRKMAQRVIMDNRFMQSINVLLVEDDADLRLEVKDYLAAEGYNVLEADSLKSTLEALQNQRIQAVVLDVGLPDGNALDALPELRRYTDCPIVMMTAWGQLPLRVKGLQQGADYYLVKPVPLIELSTVLATLFRRGNMAVSWRTDAATRTLIAANENAIALTASEWVFVQTLRKNPGRVVSREELVAALGQDPANYDPRRMDTLLQRLRQKAESAGMGELPLRTRHGQGYVWEER